MNLPKCSFIISVYKDTESLELILESLARQTIKPDEVIISEDGNSTEMAQYFASAKEKFSNLDLVHLSQEDIGWRKNIALNRAIMTSKYEYLIFIDGDCVLFDDFIENHLYQSEIGIILSGKRVELGPNMTAKIRNNEVKVENLTKYYWRYLPQLLSEKTRHLEDIIHINYDSFIAKVIKRKVRYIIGCNWSCFKSDILKINGFDETYTLPSVGEDIDLGWRFRGLGMELKSIKHNANMMHLYHKKRFDSNIGVINNEILKKNFDANRFYCENGIEKQEMSFA